MLVESTRVRELLNATVTEAALSEPDHYRHHGGYGGEEEDEAARDQLRPPREYEFSINPVPALVILLLGIMMGSHTQHEMVSAMVHKQWGDLLAGASFARGLTYVLLYLKPPRSVLPSRPPTELLTAFGLIAGGTIFMASVRFRVCSLFCPPPPSLSLLFPFLSVLRCIEGGNSKKGEREREKLMRKATTVPGYGRRDDQLRAGRDGRLHGGARLRRPAHGLGHHPAGAPGLGGAEREPRPRRGQVVGPGRFESVSWGGCGFSSFLLLLF